MGSERPDRRGLAGRRRAAGSGAGNASSACRDDACAGRSPGIGGDRAGTCRFVRADRDGACTGTCRFVHADCADRDGACTGRVACSDNGDTVGYRAVEGCGRDGVKGQEEKDQDDPAAGNRSFAPDRDGALALPQLGAAGIPEVHPVREISGVCLGSQATLTPHRRCIPCTLAGENGSPPRCGKLDDLEFGRSGCELRQGRRCIPLAARTECIAG